MLFIFLHALYVCIFIDFQMILLSRTPPLVQLETFDTPWPSSTGRGRLQT